MRSVLLIVLISFSAGSAFGQCPLPNAVIYESDQQIISLDSLATLCAPIFWFSPDEPDLYTEDGAITLPQAFPFEPNSKGPSVYYKIKEVFTSMRSREFFKESMAFDFTQSIDLSKTLRFEIEYYSYYPTEQGAGSHPHDLEAVLFQIIVHQNSECLNQTYALEVKRVVAKAHGLYWFNNILNVDQYSQFPMVILVEEGKHGNCTDKNGDGLYTPGYDVNEKPNDTWGIRDIISTGDLFTGDFQSWMAKPRNPISALFPPTANEISTTVRNANRLERTEKSQTYTLIRFPDLPKGYGDKKLAKMIKGKKPNKWPRLHFGVKSNKLNKTEKQNELRNKIGFSFTPDLNVEVSVPLLLVKHVKAPMTGGWLYHKFYTSSIDSYRDERLPINVFGHQLRHSNSASRWLDTYVGIGYELLDGSFDKTFNETVFVSEVGLKIRLNITVTPFKFLKFLGTDYWGLSMGWRNRGFYDFESGSFVLTIGAGAF